MNLLFVFASFALARELQVTDLAFVDQLDVPRKPGAGLESLGTYFADQRLCLVLWL